MTKWLIAAQGIDALTFAAFYLLIGPGLHHERNPIILALLATGGVQLVVLVKVGIAAGVGWRSDRRPPSSPNWRRIRRTAFFLATLAGLVGATFNSIAIASSIH